MICEESLSLPMGTWGGQLPRALKATEDRLPLSTMGWGGSCLGELWPVAEDTWGGTESCFLGSLFGADI